MAANIQPPAAVPPIVYVNFSAEINPSTTESLLATIANIVTQGIPAVYVLLSTQGGSVMHGLTIYNILRGLPIDLTIHNVGNVDSIGNAIFLAGQHRYACPHSTFMFHGVGFDIETRERQEEKNLRERLGTILSDQQRIGSIIEERTRLTHNQVRALFREAKTKDAAYAVSCGIVDEIRDVNIPAGSPVVSLVFQR